MGKDVFRPKGTHQDIFSFFTFTFQEITSTEVIFLSEKTEKYFRNLRSSKNKRNKNRRKIKMSQENYYGKSKEENVEIVTHAVIEARSLGLVLVESMLEVSLSGCGVGGIEWRRWEKKMKNPHFPFGSAIQSLQKSVQLVRPVNKKDVSVSLAVTSVNNTPESLRVA